MLSLRDIFWHKYSSLYGDFQIRFSLGLTVGIQLKLYCRS